MCQTHTRVVEIQEIHVGVVSRRYATGFRVDVLGGFGPPTEICQPPVPPYRILSAARTPVQKSRPYPPTKFLGP